MSASHRNCRRRSDRCLLWLEPLFVTTVIKMSRLAVLLLLSAAALVVANDDPTVSLDGVLDLDGDSFDKFVNGKKHALVEFYAPWCGHCKRLTPVYKELGEQVASDGKLASRVVIAKVNADEHRGLGERFGIQGFPTIKYFGRGKSVESPEDYNGGRTLDAFTSFLDEKIKADAGFARVEALDPLAKSFVDAGDKAAIVAQATAAAATLQGDDKLSGDLYVRFMTKAAEKGVGYLHKELARLEKMLGGGSMSASKVDEISRKISVLSAFVKSEDDAEE